ncbi:MAG: AsnC family transcriptional regulator [Dehalococcoidia bacterium]|nr:AsnC family transcriptional regulator [Dehalococcoidia bacterium]|tara:strand:- start:86 stop:676 length:591 start_codon:yes stop_codon:yes gene_type:complete
MTGNMIGRTANGKTKRMEPRLQNVGDTDNRLSRTNSALIKPRLNQWRMTPMDELDRKIIALLQLDGRASNAKIAREVGVSEGTVRRRLSRLVMDDVVKIIAVPNLEKLGYATTALIGLQTGPGKSDSVAEAIARLSEAHYVAITTGAYDVFIWAGLESAEGLGAFLRNKVGVIDGVQRTETFVNLSIKKRTYGLVL